MTGYRPPFPWIETLPGAAAVAHAGRQGWLDLGADAPPLLQGVLIGVGVLGPDGKQTPAFAQAWTDHRVDIMARAQFYCRAASDVAGGLGDLAANLPAFMDRAETFRLFRYETAQSTDPAALSETAQWVDYLEALARVESPVLAPLMPFARGDHVLEVGGNTGLMAAALASAGVRVEVLDLPAVCALGQQRRPEVTFHAGDGREITGHPIREARFDGVLFKSVLHDWPEEDAEKMLSQALSLLGDGGRIVICERDRPGPKALADPTMQGLANLVFAPFYRGASFYMDWMERHGMVVSVERLSLDMPFILLSGTQR